MAAPQGPGGPLPAGARYDPYPRPPQDGRKRRRSPSPSGMRPPPRNDYAGHYPPTMGPAYAGYPQPFPPAFAPPFRDNRPYYPYPQPGMYANGPGPYRGHAPIPQRRLDPPETVPFLLSIRDFGDYHRSIDPTLSADRIDELYQEYKADFAKRGVRRFFDDMKDKHWFQERYGLGEHKEARADRRKRGRQGRLDAWLENENLNPDYDVVPDDAPGTPAKEDASEANETKSDKEETEKTASATEQQQQTNGNSPSKTNLAGPHDYVQEGHEKTLFIKNVPVEISRKDIEAICNGLEGFEYLALSEPIVSKKWSRVGWVRFASPDNLPKAKEALCEVQIGSVTLHVGDALEKATGRKRVVPAAFGSDEHVVRDLEQMKLLVARLEKENDEDDRGSQHVEERFPEEQSDAITNKQKLDLYLHYLREVFHTCYYCQATYDFHEELEKRCALHCRAVDDDSRTPAQKQSDANLIKTFEERLPLLVDPDGTDLRPFGGKDMDEELVRLSEPFTKEEEEGKYRCKDCNKLFSAQRFVVKHISTKHPQLVEQDIATANYFNEYVKDPARLPRNDEEANAAANSDANGNRRGGRPLTDRIDRNGPPMNKRRREDFRSNLPPPPPPAGLALDPRARRGARDYADLDNAPQGAADVTELPY